MQALVGARIISEVGELDGHALLIAGGRILGVVPHRAVPPESDVTDLGGGLLAAGFIDAQVNGGGGILFNDAPTVATIRRIGAAHRRFGTTGFLPTVISDTRAVRAAAVAAVRQARRERVPGVLGIHLEGPHLNPERRGVHAARHLGPPEPADVALMTGLDDGVTLVTLAPEVVPGGTIAALAAAGVRLSAGHSAAGCERAMAGFADGITAATHLFNAMSPLASREPGLTGAALAADGVWCGIIADGHHVHDAALRLAWRCKPRGRLFLVTDAMPPVGDPAPTPAFRLDGAPIRVADGRCVTEDGRLAGAVLDMAAAVRHCVRIGIPPDEALRMASAYPADLLGIARERGRIAPGLAADLVHLDDGLIPRTTWIDGVPAAC